MFNLWEGGRYFCEKLIDRFILKILMIILNFILKYLAFTTRLVNIIIYEFYTVIY